MNIVTLLLIVVSTSAVQASDLNKKISGKWKYEATEAPYDYQKGEIVFSEQDGKANVKIVTAYEVIMAKNVKADGKNVAFEFYVDYELCKATLSLKGDKLSGEVVTVEGVIPVNLKRK